MSETASLGLRTSPTEPNASAVVVEQAAQEVIAFQHRVLLFFGQKRVDHFD